MKPLRYLTLPIGITMVSCGGGGLGLFTPPQIHNPNEIQTKAVDENSIDMGAMGGVPGSGGSFQGDFTTEDIEEIHKMVEFAPEDADVDWTPGSVGGREGKRVTWTRDFRSAIQTARMEGKPLLLWFTNSKGSAISNRLSKEVFSRGDVEAWVKNNYSPLLVDKAYEDPEDTKSILNRKRKYYEGMVKRFNVKGAPEVLVVDAGGDVYARYRGYKTGEANYYFGRLKVAHGGAVKAYGSWRERMEKKGYRMWRAAGGGKKVFAKLTKVDGEKISMVTPEGKRYSFTKNRLSLLDRDWVAKWEKLRETEAKE